MTIEQRLVKELGTTDSPLMAVWLLWDGTYVNGSWGLYVYKFMNRGNIRVGCSEAGWCFEMSRKPSRVQADRLYRAIMDAREHGTKACFGRQGKPHANPIWRDEFGFLEYLNRYTDYYPPIDVQQHYFEYIGKPLIDYGY